MGILDAPSTPTKASQFTGVPASLDNLDRALAQRLYRKVNIMAVGDSLFEGREASAYRNSMIPKLQDALRGAYPTPGQGGGGWSGGLDTIGSAWSIEGGLGPQDFIPATTGTVTKATGATVGLGLGRRNIFLTAGATLTFTTVRCTGFDIEHAKTITPTGGTYTYSVDGGTPVAVTTASTRTTLTAATTIGATAIAVASIPSDWRIGTELRIDTTGTLETAFISSINTSTLVVTLTSALAAAHASGVAAATHGNGGYLTPIRGLTEGNHVVTITTSTGATILGVDYYLNDETKGIHVHNAGHAGIRADQCLSTGATDHWLQSLGARSPDAIICDLWYNDTGAQTSATYISNLTSLRTQVNTACAQWGLAQPSWIQLVPYGTATTRFQGALSETYYGALRNWADADTSGPGGKSGIFLLDCSRLMPRTDATASGYYNDSDRVHYLDPGAARWAQVTANNLPLNRASTV